MRDGNGDLEMTSNPMQAAGSQVKCRTGAQALDCSKDEESGEFYCDTDPLTGGERRGSEEVDRDEELSEFQRTFRAATGELLGTMLLVVFGCGAVASSVTSGALGLVGVAIVFGAGVTLAILCTAPLSGAHLNPAMSLAFALLRPREFSPTKLPLYVFSQLIGGILGGLVVLAAFGPVISQFERENDIFRGDVESAKSAMVFCEYFPNPAIYGTGAVAAEVLGKGHAVFVEALGTFLLSFVIFAATHRANAGLATTPGLVPAAIGVTVTCIICALAPQTQAGLNPARDFGPRLVAAISGWGHVAIPGPRGGFWVYILGPCLGAPAGAFLHDRVIVGLLRRKVSL